MNVQEVLDNRADYRDKLFARGFLFTDADVNSEEYPFYGMWSKTILDRFTLFLSPKQHAFVEQLDNMKLILIGHAYDPVNHIAEESKILSNLLYCLKEKMTNLFWDRFNQISGVFTVILIKKGSICVIGDPTCMQSVFYSLYEGHIYITSHTALLGDLLNLSFDAYVKRLTQYKFFPLLGNSLPGDLTPYSDVKRLIPNHYVCMSASEGIHVVRFYTPYKSDLELKKIEKEVSSLLHENLSLIAEKWKKPAISLTGGCDSKTTLACANGLYDRFIFFSYESSESERVDAIAARTISEALGIRHTLYKIPDQDEKLKDIEIVRCILNHNSGCIIPTNRNDVRKRAFFADTEDFDIEVKSWASEIGRSYYSKRFHGRVHFGKKPTARKCTTMYKFFLHDRKLVKDTDKVFEKYLEKYFQQDKKNPVEWQEQFFWEFRVPSWNGLVITGEHRYSYDITIPYNNRILLNLLLSVPIDLRITDQAYSDIRAQMNPVVDQTGIEIQNLKHTRRRELLENIYYIIHNHIL